MNPLENYYGNRTIDKKKLINGIKQFFYYLTILILLWTWGTNVYQAFKCPSMTRTQQFLHLPKTVMLDFQSEPVK